MPIYFFVQEAAYFHHQIDPALAACWQQRSFEPCRQLCKMLRPAVLAFAERFYTGPDDPLLSQVEQGLPFDRDIWRCLVGEILLYSARDIPDIQTAPDTLCSILAPEHYLEENTPRADLAPIQQAHFGTRDLVLGGRPYRPEHAGWNDVADVARLAQYLETIDPTFWTLADMALLQGMSDDEERAEELELVRDWFPDLQNLYRQAEENRQIIVCEEIQSAPVF
jgi:hypothetical protein